MIIESVESRRVRLDPGFGIPSFTFDVPRDEWDGFIRRFSGRIRLKMSTPYEFRQVFDGDDG